MAIIEAALKHDVFLMEAFMYRCHPQTKKLIELIREKAIGEVRIIQATFSFHAGFDPKSRAYANELGGGGILDVGCYCTSMAGAIAGAALGKDGAVEPLEVKGHGVLGQTRVDHYTIATAKYPGNILAQLSTGVEVNQESVVRIFGSAGSIFVPSPWFCSRHGDPSKLIVTKNGKTEEVIVEAGADLYAIEADTVANNLQKRQAPFPAMTLNDSLVNMRTLDMWRDTIGLVYDAEKFDAVPTVHRRPLAVQPGHNMKYGKIPGIEKQVSRLIMGVDNQRTMPHASVMLDDFIEKGGNCFDVAWVYGGGGHMEKVLGQYVKNRGIREKIVILGKGAHTPECNPEALTRQLRQSLERLQTDYVDMYMMHRDNPEIPVKEFIDVLNEHKKAGRMRAFGGSNWSIQRVEQANEYAKSKGLTGLVAVSNNFSLARMVDPVWGGCIHASDPASRAWFTKTQLTLMPWSSQARGFFTDRANPNDQSDAELVRCWYSDDNFKRRDRVIEMAKKRNVLPIQIALAYVLCQPFPTFPLIGPRALSETRTSLPALDIQLTPQELKWLNLED
jgi:aryl-alcohol dehydrogenase-like predicted oxidoreductase